jgi:hypothetical protein
LFEFVSLISEDESSQASMVHCYAAFGKYHVRAIATHCGNDDMRERSSKQKFAEGALKSVLASWFTAMPPSANITSAH